MAEYGDYNSGGGYGGYGDSGGGGYGDGGGGFAAQGSGGGYNGGSQGSAKGSPSKVSVVWQAGSRRSPC